MYNSLLQVGIIVSVPHSQNHHQRSSLWSESLSLSPSSRLWIPFRDVLCDGLSSFLRSFMNLLILCLSFRPSSRLWILFRDVLCDGLSSSSDRLWTFHPYAYHSVFISSLDPSSWCPPRGFTLLWRLSLACNPFRSPSSRSNRLLRTHLRSLCRHTRYVRL